MGTDRIRYTAAELVEIRNQLGFVKAPDTLQFPRSEDGSACRWARTVRSNYQKTKQVSFQFPPKVRCLSDSSFVEPENSITSMLRRASGRLILDAVNRPKRKPLEIPITVSACNGQCSTNSNKNNNVEPLKKRVSKDYVLNMVTGELVEVGSAEAAVAASNASKAPNNSQPTKVKPESLKLDKLFGDEETKGQKQENKFSIFGIAVQGIQWLNELDPLSPEQMRSDSTGVEQKRFGFDSWVDVFSAFEVEGGQKIEEKVPEVPETMKLDIQNRVDSTEMLVNLEPEAQVEVEAPAAVQPLQTWSPIIEQLDKAALFHSLVVKSVTSPDRFFLQREPTEASSKYAQEFLEDMGEWYNEYVTQEEGPTCPTSSQLEKFRFYVAFVMDTGRIVRIFIVNIEPDEQIRVLLIDEGTEALMEARYVLPLFEEFCSLPMQTFPAELHVVPKEESTNWTNAEIEQFRAEVEGRKFYFGIIERKIKDFGEIPVLSVTLINEGKGDHDQKIYTFGNRLTFGLQ